MDKLVKGQELDAPSLKACMNSAQTTAHIKQDQTDGDSIHVSSTPTFFVNGKLHVGQYEFLPLLEALRRRRPGESAK